MPKKSKKGGGGGKMDEEAAKKKEELLVLFLKDKLQKEELNSRENLVKLNDGWREILSRARVTELQEVLEVLVKTFRSKMDSLNNIIQSLERDLQGAECQAAQAARNHLQHVERLWEQQQKNLQVAQQRWEEGLHHLSSAFKCERTQMHSHTLQQREQVDDAKLLVQQQQKLVMSEIHKLYSDCVAAYESAHEDQMAALVVDGMTALREKERQQQETLRLHQQEAKEAAELRLKNVANVELRDRNMMRIKKLQGSVFQLRMELKSNKTKSETEERDLTAARNKFNHRSQKLRLLLTRAHAAFRAQLTDLSLSSAAAAESLTAVIAKGEKVLRVADMCRKLEQQHLDVLTAAPAPRLRQEEEQDFPGLGVLMGRLTVARLQLAALQQRRERVAQENQALRLLLRRHLDALALRDPAEAALRDPAAFRDPAALMDPSVLRRHPILTVSRAPTTTDPSDPNKHTSVVEAVDTLKYLR